MKRGVLWIIVGVIVVILLGVSMRSDSSKSATGASESSSTTSTPVAIPAASSTKEFTVTGKNFSFEPAALNVKKGDVVTIHFVNSGGFHDFRIDAFNVATEKLNGGAQTSVTFTADKTGVFEYYCSVGEHRAMGMKGVFTVTE